MTAPDTPSKPEPADGVQPDRALLERLPKSSIQHLYRTFVAPSRNESKDDMVAMLWRTYNSGKNAHNFWLWVRDEWNYVERCKAAKLAGLPKPVN